MRRILQIVLAAVCLLALLAACTPAVPSVVIYTSVDQVYAEPILKQYEEQTGVRVLAVYDVEAAKTTGLVNRLLAEMDRPQADVFWSGEFVQTLLLKENGALAAYASPQADSLPAASRDPDGCWTAFGGRARVLLVNTNRVALADAPRRMADLLDPRWDPSRVGIANPLFGTTYTQAAAVYAALGDEAAQQFFTDLQARGVRVLDGNSVVRDLVASGELDFGLTDTDDACGAVEKGAPVALVYLDQGEGEMGTLVIPNTVALVAGAPHPEQGRALVDYLLSPEVEAELVASGWIQSPSRAVADRPACPADLPQRGMLVTLAEIYARLERAKTDLTEIFLH